MELPSVEPRQSERAGVRLGRAPLVLGGFVVIAIAYAAFASGAINLPQSARLEVGIAALSAVTAFLVALGKLRFATASPALSGLMLLTAFALWTGISLDWSTAPDLGWEELDRTIAYVLFTGIAIVLGASLRRSATLVALGFLAVATVVALYALGGKAFPAFSIGELIDLNHSETFARLRAPFGYWNALALFSVLAAPIALRLAGDRAMLRPIRMAGVATLALLIVTVALSYSRGGMIALVIAIGALIAFSADRARLFAYTVIALIGALPALFVAFVRDDLTRDGLEVGARTGDGYLFALALIAGVAGALILAARVLPFDDRLRTPSFLLTTRTKRVGIAAAGGLAILLTVVAIGGGFSSFTTPKSEKRNDPGRVLQANAGNRWVWWQEAIGAWDDRKLGGHGAGSFPVTHLRYRQNTLEVRQAHSVPLQWLAQTGVIGALLAAGGLGLLGFAGGRRLLRSPPRERVYGVALAAACVAWGVHMWVDWDWDIPGVTLPLLLFLGVLAARPPEAGEPPPRTGLPQRALRVTGAVALIVAAVIISIYAIRPSLARDKLLEANRLSESKSPAKLKQAAKAADEAADLNPRAVEPLFAASRIADQRKRYRRAAAYLVEAVDRQPHSFGAWLRLFAFQLKLDDLDGARDSITVMSALDRLGAAGPLEVYTSYLTDLPSSSASATGTPLPEAAPVLQGVTAPAPAVTAPSGSGQ